MMVKLQSLGVVSYTARDNEHTHTQPFPVQACCVSLLPYPHAAFNLVVAPARPFGIRREGHPLHLVFTKRLSCLSK